MLSGAVWTRIEPVLPALKGPRAGLRRHRRHAAPERRLRKAGRRARVHRGGRTQRATRATRDLLDTSVSTGHRRCPPAQGFHQLCPRRGPVRHRRADHSDQDRCHRGGRCCGPTRPTTATTWSLPPSAGVPGSPSPPARTTSPRPHQPAPEITPTPRSTKQRRWIRARGCTDGSAFSWLGQHRQPPMCARRRRHPTAAASGSGAPRERMTR